jgi:hypothetical protein
MRKSQKLNENGLMKGQSLVETALFLPILIFILAGIVEVSTLLITQNRVTTASRVATGFGAVNYDRNDWQGTAESMGIVALSSITDTMDMDEGVWDIWSIYAKVNKDGTDFEEFVATHVIGNNSVISTEEWTAREAEVRADMLAELQSTGISSASDLEVVSTVSYHNQQTMLNLPIWQWVGYQTVRGLTVMRVDGPTPYAGCPLLPIALGLDQYSIYPQNWSNTSLYSYYADGDPNAGGYYPHDVVRLWAGNLDYPDDPPLPLYINISDEPMLESEDPYYDRHAPGIPLIEAHPGYIYRAREKEGPDGSFGWLCWRGPNCNATALADSLIFPGNFMDEEVGYPGGDADMDEIGHPLLTFPTGNKNGYLEFGGDIEEWVRSSTGNMSSIAVREALKFYIDEQIPVTLIVFDAEWPHPKLFRVAGFVTARIIGYEITGSDKYMVFEYIDWKQECTPVE